MSILSFLNQKVNKKFKNINVIHNDLLSFNLSNTILKNDSYELNGNKKITFFKFTDEGENDFRISDLIKNLKQEEAPKIKIIKKDSFQIEKMVIFSFRKGENILEIRFTFIEKIKKSWYNHFVDMKTNKKWLHQRRDITHR